MEPLSNWDAMFVAAASPYAILPRAKGCIKVSGLKGRTLLDMFYCICLRAGGQLW